MTISISWIRSPSKNTSELIVCSDSRLRSRGSMDQAQKIFPLDRGDICLAFCGDTQFAYPIFVQTATMVNNNIKTRTRGDDVTKVRELIGNVMNSLLNSWNLSEKEKEEELRDTNILFTGWSWEYNRYEMGYFHFSQNKFLYNNGRSPKTNANWKFKEKLRLIGDYKREYMDLLSLIIKKTYSDCELEGNKEISLDFEPLQALCNLIEQSKSNNELSNIGGAVQMVKVYKFSQSLPFVIQYNCGQRYLLGRRMEPWEITEKPILQLDKKYRGTIFYPLSNLNEIFVCSLLLLSYFLSLTNFINY